MRSSHLRGIACSFVIIPAFLSAAFLFFLLHISQDRLIIRFSHRLAVPREDFTAVVFPGRYLPNLDRLSRALKLPQIPKRLLAQRCEDEDQGEGDQDSEKGCHFI